LYGRVKTVAKYFRIRDNTTNNLYTSFTDVTVNTVCVVCLRDRPPVYHVYYVETSDLLPSRCKIYARVRAFVCVWYCM